MSEENGNGNKDVTRISISVDPALRRNMRIAAAISDMTVGEWAQEILERYATKAAKGV